MYWKHRNRVIFRGGVIDVLEVFALVQLKACAWVTSKSHDAIISFSDWCVDHLVCMEMMFCLGIRVRVVGGSLRIYLSI